MTHLLMTLALSLASPAQASDRDEVQALLTQAQATLAAADASADYRATAQALRTAIRALEGSPAPAHNPRVSRREVFMEAQRQRCIDLGFEVHQGVADTTRLERATAMCPSNVDAEILDLAYEVYRPGRHPRTAFRNAVEFAGDEDLVGKHSLLVFAFDIYKPGRHHTTALGQARAAIRETPASREPCVRRAFDQYRPGRHYSTALTMAVDLCNRE